jgi:hypothetical protein
MSETIPEQYYDYTLSFLRAIAAITSDVTGFDDDLKDAYKEHLERFPIDPDDDWDDEC